MHFMWWLLVLVLNLLFRVPHVGRPKEHFFGAIGHRLSIEMKVDRTELQVDEATTLTVRIRGAWNPSQVVRPDLRRIADFSRHFVIDDLPTTRSENSICEFRYRLRPRSESVDTVSPIVVRYWDPVVGYFAATAPLDPILLQVRPHSSAAEDINWANKPEWLFESFDVRDLEWDQEVDRRQVIGMCLALLGPACVWLAWFVRWCTRNVHRSSNGCDEWQVWQHNLQRLKDEQASLSEIAKFVEMRLEIAMKRWRGGGETSAPVNSMEERIASSEKMMEWRAVAERIRRRCERARFGPPGIKDDALVEDAMAFVMDLVGGQRAR